nr:TPA_asm: hypothetical protein HUJ06_015626 [Nelumbo nucifera]
MPVIYGFYASVSFPSYLLFRKGEMSKNNLSPFSTLRNSMNEGGSNLLALLNLCKKLEDLKQFKSHLILHGAMEDEYLVGEFLRLCFYLDVHELALGAFYSIQKPTLFLQNIMLRCLCNHGLYKELLALYLKCQKSGCLSDNFTFPFVIKACAALSDHRTGKEVHCTVLRTGFEQNLVVQTGLIDMYAKVGHMEKSRLLFDRAPQLDLVSWNALLSGYSMNGLYQEAIEVFKQIWTVGLKPNASTLATIVPVCTHLRILDTGRSLHGFAVKCGFCSDEALVPAFISMYGGVGDLCIVRKLFDLLPERNVIAWNAMISAYTQNKRSSEAFELFRLMLQGNMLPNSVTYISMFTSCDYLGSSWCGESLHASGIKHGLEHQISVTIALISLYAKDGDIDSAKFLFDEIPEKNLLSWNSMISGYVQNGFLDLGLAAFRNMQTTGLIPDAVSIVTILSACSRLDGIHLGKSAHAFILRNGFESNINVLNSLLAFYCDPEQLSSSLVLFHKMAMRNVVSWNTLIAGCVHTGNIGDAISLLRQMQQEDVRLDLVTIITILPGFCETEGLVQGMAIHGHAIKIGCCSDISLVNALVSMYFNCGDLSSGILLFECMPERSVVSWNALLTGYRYHNLHREAIVLFRRMTMEVHKPNYVTLLNVLPICSTQLQGRSIHAYAVRTGAILEPPLFTSIVLMYARFENVNVCCLLFKLVDKSNISMWNTMMAVHVQSKNSQNAVATFCELLQTEVEPDHITILTLISASLQLRSQNLTQCIMAYIICKGFEKDVFIYNALIDLNARCGNIFVARKLFDFLAMKDAISWSVMINAYGMHGNGEAALSLFSQMKNSGVGPDDITFVSILSACSHAGLLDEGQVLFNSIAEHGMQPGMEHYSCLVDLLGRTGRLHEAFDLVKSLPFKPSASLLESLLGACCIHGNIKLGEEIGKRLSEIDPENSNSYVMLSNIYAAAGRWTDACRLRSEMEGKQLRKLPGFSLLGVN